MTHIQKKDVEVMQIYLQDFRREIYGRELTGKVLMSQKSVALTLERLEKEHLLKSKRRGNIRYYRLNEENLEVRDVLVIAEVVKKLEFLRQHRKIAHLLGEDSRVVGIFGSYATGTQKHDSDIDLFIIGGREKEDYDAKGKLFDLDISIKYFSEDQFKIKKSSLCREIAKGHVLLFGAERFIALLWEGYYGLD